MAHCIRERGADCRGVATRRITAREGGWNSVKCEPCLTEVQRRTGKAFDDLYHVSEIPDESDRSVSRSLCYT